MRLRPFLTSVLTIILLATIPVHSRAQPKATLLLAVPSDYQKLFAAQLGAFEATVPDVQVTLVTSEVRFPDMIDDLDVYLGNVRMLASSADLVLVDSAVFTPFATRTQSFLDLKPFTDTDRMLNPADYYPAIQKSFEWDGGNWAIPFAADVGLFTYDPAAFDAASLAYPTPQWTLENISSAARTLSQKGDDGKTRSGLDTSNTLFQAALFRSLLSSPVYDSSVLPNTPALDTPEAARLLETWSGLIKEGVVSMGSNAPLDMTDPLVLDKADHKLAGALLPGGQAAVRAYGLAVSKGTRYPDFAYAVARYFANVPGLTLGETQLPARINLLVKTGSPGQALAQQAIEKAFPAAEMRFANYLSVAFRKMIGEGLDAHMALQAVQLAAAQNLQTAADFANKGSITVPTPVPVMKGVSLTFPVSFSSRGYTNFELWQRLADEFISHDPEVRQINFTSDVPPDCRLDTFSNSNLAKAALPAAWLPSFFLDFKPLIGADSTFDETDFIGDSLKRVQVSDKLLAYPIALMPAFLKYDPAQFKRAGVPEPTNDWTINDFVEALKQLKRTSEVVPFQQNFTLARGVQPGALHLTLLMAAFGESPIDYSSTPPALKNDAGALDSAQQVLDLVKGGYIKYYENGFGYINQELWNTLRNNTDHPPITTEVLNPYTTRHLLNGIDQNDPYRPVFYPRGNHARPIAYDLIAATINPKSPYPDACYRWIRFLATHPELIQAMPASRLALDNPLLNATHGGDLVMLYKQIDQLFHAPDVVIFPLRASEWTALFADYWVGQAFNAYVLKDADLQNSLTQATSKFQSYLEQCEAKNNLPINVPDNDSALDRVENTLYSALKRCAWRIDPTLVKYG